MKKILFALSIAIFNALVAPVHANSGETLSREQASEVVRDIHATLRANIFDPRMLETDEYHSMRKKTDALVQDSMNRNAFVRDFNQIWVNGPFSHVQLSVARQSAAQTSAFLDSMRVGKDGATLSWREDIPILTVNTMMGQDTTELIRAAFSSQRLMKSPCLIIDLRENRGGTFAVVPLVSHLIEKETDAGVFVSQIWSRTNADKPDKKKIAALPSWQGWSLTSFWNDVQSGEGLLRVSFTPAKPRFAGRVYVLTSRRTASAAEMGLDALLSAGRVTVVGERTAGQMLSQKMYDIEHGYLLALPIADYIGLRDGRIESRGIMPTVEVAADQALVTALSLARADVPAQ
jgi:carboxyl-terminal processing protease